MFFPSDPLRLLHEQGPEPLVLELTRISEQPFLSLCFFVTHIWTIKLYKLIINTSKY